MARQPVSKNIVFQKGKILRSDREKFLKQKGCILWLTGLSGSGKSTLARHLELELYFRGRVSYILDGDNVRHGLNADLGFSATDREENIRRIGQVAALFADAGLITICAFISPYRSDREKARALVNEERFIEIFVDAPLEVCEQRDPKGLYQKARKGEITDFTGISAPYESPLNAELTLRTDRDSLDDCCNQTIGYLEKHKIIW